MKLFDEAVEDIKAAIKLAPGDKKLRDEFERVKKSQLENKKKQSNAL